MAEQTGLNPFDHAFSVIKEVQHQVHELEEALSSEKRERCNEVAHLKMLLQQERDERTTAVDQLQLAASVEMQRLISAQDRVRFDVGDLRAAVKQEHNERMEECQKISERLSAETGHLTKFTEELAATQNSRFTGLASNLATETQDRIDSHNALGSSLLNEAARIRDELDQLAKELAEYKQAMDSDYSRTKTSTEDIIKDLAWITNHLRGVGAISDAFKDFHWASMKHSASTTAGSPLDSMRSFSTSP